MDEAQRDNFFFAGINVYLSSMKHVPVVSDQKIPFQASSIFLKIGFLIYAPYYALKN